MFSSGKFFVLLLGIIIYTVYCSVINTFKSMLNDEDILEKDDLYILDRMKEFVLSDDVAQVGASRSLLPLIERAVSYRNFLINVFP